MNRLLIATLLCGTLSVPAPASAFWRRSQVSMCGDATTDAERARLRCWELDGYLDRGWPALGLGGHGLPGAYPPPPPSSPALGRGVTRRLG